MVINLEVKNILWTADNRKDFEERIKNPHENQDFVDFFKAKLGEFAADAPDGDKAFTYRLWEIVYANANPKRTFADFEKDISLTTPANANGELKDTNVAQEWLNIYYPKEKTLLGTTYGSEVWSTPRGEITALIMDNMGVIATTDSNKNTALYDSSTGDYTGLRGDLDLADFVNLTELNVSRNPFLGKVNISNCLKLKSLFVNSHPQRVTDHNEQMDLSDWIVSDDYPNLEIFMTFGSKFMAGFDLTVCMIVRELNKLDWC